MTVTSRLLTAIFAVTACTTLASASTITLDSYGTVNSTGSTTAGVGAGNTALKYLRTYNSSTKTITAPSSTATYNLPASSPWASLPGTNSSWVSFNPNNYVGGSKVAPAGTYVYQTSFFGSSNSTGTLTVLADDSASIFLNSTLITLAAAPVQAPNCTAGTPNCLHAATYTLTGFNNGLNTLSFGVTQDFASATGLDFAGSVLTPSPAPEPSSLVLLGTGILSAAGAVRRRFRS